MSVVLGIEAPGGAWLAWDSCVSFGDDECAINDRHSPKVWQWPDLAIGGVGGALAMQAMSYIADIPPPLKGADVEHWAFTDLAAMRPEGLTLIVATRGQVVTLTDEGFAWRSEYSYAAIGCGATLALGRLAGTGDPRTRAREAVMAASRHSPWVSEPVHLLWVAA